MEKFKTKISLLPSLSKTVKTATDKSLFYAQILSNLMSSLEMFFWLDT